MNDINNMKTEIENLNTDQSLSGIFILLSIATIIGDEFVKKYYINKDQNAYKIAKKIFISALIITLLIYLYFLKNSKREYYEQILKNEETFPHLIRLIGSILLVVGISCLLYFQITDDELTGVVPL